MISRRSEPIDSASERRPWPEPKSRTRPPLGNAAAISRYGVNFQRSQMNHRVESGAPEKREGMLVVFAEFVLTRYG